jgi:hypothetical protein
VEAGQRGHAIGVRRRDPPADSPAHAVAGDRDRTRSYFCQIVEVGGAVARGERRGELLDQWSNGLHEARTIVRVAEVRRRQHRRSTCSVEDVRRQDDITAGRDPVRHLLDPRAQPDRVDDEQHPRIRTIIVRAGEIGICHPILGRNVDHRAPHRPRIAGPGATATSRRSADQAAP